MRFWLREVEVKVKARPKEAVARVLLPGTSWKMSEKALRKPEEEEVQLLCVAEALQW